MKDAAAILGPEAQAARRRGDLADLAYADDTLLLSVSQKHLQEYLRAVTTQAAGTASNFTQASCNYSTYAARRSLKQTMAIQLQHPRIWRTLEAFSMKMVALAQSSAAALGSPETVFAHWPGSGADPA